MKPIIQPVLASDGKVQLTSDNLSQSVSRIDKDHFIKTYISSQKEFCHHFATEGQKAIASWECDSQVGSTKDAEKITESVADAGFNTPVLKPRVAKSVSDLSSAILCNKQLKHARPGEIGSTVSSAPPAQKSHNRRHTGVNLVERNSKKLPTSSGAIIRPRQSEKPLADHISSSYKFKTSAKPLSTTKKRARAQTPDSERVASGYF